MSNWSQRPQVQLEISNDVCGITIEYNDSHDRIVSQPYPSPNNPVATSSTVNLNLNTSVDQQLHETNVTVSLFDCMKCYIRIPRCQVEQQHLHNTSDKSTQTDFVQRCEDLLDEQEKHVLLYNTTTTTTKIDLNHQLHELRQEQENTSHNQPNTLISLSEDEAEQEEFSGLGWGMDDFHFMDSYIIMDLPWPLTPPQPPPTTTATATATPTPTLTPED